MSKILTYGGTVKAKFSRTPRVMLIAALTVMLSLVVFGLVYASTPAAFVVSTAPTTSEGNPIGIVASTNALLFTEWCVSANRDREIFSVDDLGAITVFGTISPAVSSRTCAEEYLDISPGFGGFTADNVFVTKGAKIFEYTSTGTLVGGTFATVPSCGGDHTGITFDREGTFGNKMIISCTTGDLYTVDSSGAVLFLATITSIVANGLHENPEVIPVGFGPKGGQVWTAAEGPGLVLATTPGGVVTTVIGGISRAESVHVIPATVCDFGNSGGAYFVTDTFGSDPDIVQFPATDFAGLAGNVLVIGEFGNPIIQISLNATGTGYVKSTFDSTGGRHHEGATFARCPDFNDDDEDNVPNNLDACPNTPGRPEYQGCPVGDKNTVDLHIIDQAKSGACPTAIGEGGAGSCKFPIGGAEVRVFDRNNPDFQQLFTKNPSKGLYGGPNGVYETDIGRVGACTTDATGMCIAGEEKIGDYLVIVKVVSSVGTPTYTGKPKSPGDFVDNPDLEGDVPDLATKDFQIIQVIKKPKNIGDLPGLQRSGGKKNVIDTGGNSTSFALGINLTDLVVIHPDYAIWEEGASDWVYSFIFNSGVELTVDLCGSVPKGYVLVGVYADDGSYTADATCSTTLLAGVSLAAAYEVVDLASPRPSFYATGEAKGKGKGKGTDAAFMTGPTMAPLSLEFFICGHREGTADDPAGTCEVPGKGKGKGK